LYKGCVVPPACHQIFSLNCDACVYAKATTERVILECMESFVLFEWNKFL
jgi:hypothetical protein